MAEINRHAVSLYWERVTPTIMGPYMMDGYGFPASAGHYRFRSERQIVERLIQDVDRNGAVLDLGSGIGYWAEEFARSFARVDAIEGSSTLYPELEKRCLRRSNMRAFLGDALSFEPDQRYSLIFLGGLLMYLGEKDMLALLQRLTRLLKPGGIILSRESTVRGRTVLRTGDYTVAYRSVQSYTALFQQSNLTIRHIERNEAYILLEMGCESIEKWKTLIPKPFQALSWVGHLSYWGLRLGNPWIQELPKVFRRSFPTLENHFFVLEAAMDSTSGDGSS